MSTLTDFSADVWRGGVVASEAERLEKKRVAHAKTTWSEHDFAEEQLWNLVRRLFSPGWPVPMRQVLFTGVESETDVLGICMMLARVLAAQATGTVCVVDAAAKLNKKTDISSIGSRNDHFGNLHDLSRQVSDRVWLMPREVFMLGSEGLPLVGIRARLAEIRLEFDHTIVCGPAASSCGEAELLASMCEGVVLVLQANSTRRIAAQKVIERLRAANVPLLGTVLTKRQFPVPDAIYRRL